MSEASADLAAFLLLDRSGSMASRWDEALGALNTYAKELPDARATLATFDSVEGLRFEVIRDRVRTGEWKDVTAADATPRGGTPLLDAIARIVALAEAEPCEKTVLIIVTDGAENQSREVTKANARAALDRCRSRGWQVVFLGADFDAFDEGGQVGVAPAQILAMRGGSYSKGMARLRSRTERYRSAGEGIAFSQEDRDEAGGKE